MAFWMAPIIAGGIAAAGTAAAAGIGAKVNSDNMSAEERRRAEMLARLDAIRKAQYSQGTYGTEKYNPEAYGAPEDAQYQEVEIDPRMREQQMAALSSIRDRYNGVADAEMNAANYAAMNQGNRLAQGREGAIMQNAQARGAGGGGLEMVMRAQAAQEGANRATMGGLEGAKNSALQKLAGQSAFMQGMGNVRNQDTQLAGMNADIINRFNQRNTDMRNQVNMGNTDMQNSASKYNGATKASDRAANLDRGDRNANSGFQQSMQKATGGNVIDRESGNAMSQGADRNAALAATAIQSGTNMAGQALMTDWERKQRGY